MKVYVVMGGWDYEGYSELDMKVFSNEKQANMYAESLRNKEYSYNYVNVIENEIE